MTARVLINPIKQFCADVINGPVNCFYLLESDVKIHQVFFIILTKTFGKLSIKFGKILQ